MVLLFPLLRNEEKKDEKKFCVKNADSNEEIDKMMISDVGKIK